jgi:hypothetical protein
LNKKDYVIISFFVVIFVAVLYERKLKPLFSDGASQATSSSNSASSSGNGTEASALNGKFGDIVKSLTGSSDPHPVKGTPPAGLNTKSFYDEKGNFKSYYEGKVPDEFFTKKEYFTDPAKMEEDAHYKSSKMLWHQDAERLEFQKFHDYRGKDKKKYNELLESHARALSEIRKKNFEKWKEFRKEYYNRDSDLR